MTTRISDIVHSEELTAYINQRVVETNAFLASGVAVTSDQLNQFLAGQGETFSIPHWNPLTGAPNAGSTNPASSATAGKLTAGKQTARRLSWNNGWSMADLAASVAGDDPLRSLGDFLAAYWDTQINSGVINVARGILADNDTNDNDDMFTNVATDAAGAVGDAEKISGNVVIDAQQTLGDRKNQVTAIGMHSVQHATLQKLGLLVDVLDPQTGHVMYETYLGKRVIVDDALPAVSGTNRITYTGVLFGNGAMGLGFGDAKVPEEYDRKAAQGDGAGVEEIWSRRELIIHPTGFKWLEGSVAGESPTQAELAEAANWDRVWDRKNVPLAFFKTNG